MSWRMLAVIAVAAITLAGLAWLLPATFAPNQRAVPPPVTTSALQMSAAEVQQTVQEVLALTLPDLGGQRQSIAQWRGKILVVNYWASWCAPCVEEIPAFSRLQRQYAAQGVQFVGIGIDNVENMQAFVKATPISYPLLVADPAASQMPGLQIKGLPYTLVIGPDGRVQGSRLGRLDESRLNSILQRLAPR